MHTFYFKKLEVWKNSRKLVIDVYKTTEKYPIREKYNFINQIRRSVLSISNNLAEGSAKKTAKEQARYTSIAFGSAIELLNLLILSNDLKYLSDKEFEQFEDKIGTISRQLNALHFTQINRSKKQIK